jgi:hypothetical protein
MGERSDCGQDIVMKHTDIRGPAMKDLSSLRASDDAAKAVQKTEHRISLDSMLSKIVAEEYISPPSVPYMTIAVIILENGWVLVGKSAPADPDNFDRELGCKFAKEDAVRQLWQLEGYLLREKLWQGDVD